MRLGIKLSQDLLVWAR